MNDLKSLSNNELTERLSHLVTRERKITTLVIEHVAEFMSRGLFLEHSCNSIYAYLTERLNYSGSTAQNRIDAARLILEVPGLKEDLANGSINLTQVSLVSRALRQFHEEKPSETPEPCVQSLIDNIRGADTRQSAITIARELDLNLKNQEKVRHQKDESVVLEITLTKEQMEFLTRARDLQSHIEPGGTWASVISHLAKDYLKRKDLTVPKSKHRTVVAGRNRHTRERLDNTNNVGKLKATANSQYARIPIPMSTKRQVASRDHVCRWVDERTGERCNSSFQLQFDHIKPVWAGGSNEAENLQLLCSIHNQMKYRQGH